MPESQCKPDLLETFDSITDVDINLLGGGMGGCPVLDVTAVVEEEFRNLVVKRLLNNLDNTLGFSWGQLTSSRTENE